MVEDASITRAQNAQEILPILKERCQLCHQSGSPQGGLSLAAYPGLLRGGHGGPAIVVGEPDQSLLIKKITGPTPEMPKLGRPVTAGELDLIRRWIREGAINDGSRDDADRTWWSFRPLTRPAVPAVEPNWPRTPIDRYILAKLQENGLEPSPEADRRNLIRRVTYDLHGLPPTPKQVQEFLNDPSPRMGIEEI